MNFDSRAHVIVATNCWSQFHRTLAITSVLTIHAQKKRHGGGPPDIHPPALVHGRQHPHPLHAGHSNGGELSAEICLRRADFKSEARSFRCSSRWPAVPQWSPEQVRGSGVGLPAVWEQSAVLYWW